MILFQSKFLSWGGEHLLWLLAGVASMVFWITLGRLQLSELRKRQVGLVMTLIPVVIWLWASVHFYRTTNPLRLDLILPFHVCYFLNLAMPIMLWRRSYALFEVSYFMVMAGTIQAFLRPISRRFFPTL